MNQKAAIKGSLAFLFLGSGLFALLAFNRVLWKLLSDVVDPSWHGESIWASIFICLGSSSAFLRVSRGDKKNLLTVAAWCGAVCSSLYLLFWVLLFLSLFLGS
jgi:hypothetical protein